MSSRVVFVKKYFDPQRNIFTRKLEVLTLSNSTLEAVRYKWRYKKDKGPIGDTGCSAKLFLSRRVAACTRHNVNTKSGVAAHSDLIAVYLRLCQCINGCFLVKPVLIIV